jgi:hypothetical protein
MEETIEFEIGLLLPGIATDEDACIKPTEYAPRSPGDRQPGVEAVPAL